MTIRAVFFDLGGVILRTEQREPRTRLAQSLGMSYEEVEKVVFENKSSLQASLGAISEDQHWQNVTHSLHLPDTEVERVRSEFFAGDRIDAELLKLMRSLRPAIKIGLISNAWSGMRAWITCQNFADAFDDMVISAEIGWAKPDARIYQAALQNLQVLPEEAVFLDDMLRNVEGARKVGMHAIQFVQPEQALGELKAFLAG
jgi:epoxide hydrolase-like predicted phosphatase